MTSRWVKPLVITLVGALALSACGSKVDSDDDSTATKPCGTVNIAVNPWVGIEANVAVVAYLAKNKLGCNVVEKNLTEEVSWQGFSTGAVDVILENSFGAQETYAGAGQVSVVASDSPLREAALDTLMMTAGESTTLWVCAAPTVR